MSAPVRIEARAWNDPRFRTLARLTGLADPDFAIIKVARIWSWQTERFGEDRNAYVVDRDTVESILGEHGWDALLRSRLADEVPGGLRMRGTEGQIEWCADLSSKRQHAGRERAAKARRDNAGRMISNEAHQEPAHAGSAGPASTSTKPAQSSAPTPTPEDLTPARAIPPSTKPCPVPTPSLDSLWSELEAERARVAAALAITLPPMVAHDAGRHDLATILSEASRSQARDAAVDQVRHAIAVAGAEAEASRDPQWLTGAVFRPNNFRRLGAASLELAGKPRDGPRNGRSDRPPERKNPLRPM